MSRPRTLLLALLAIARSASAQPLECPGCILGLYDDPEMTRTSGQMAGTSKVLYLGIRYASGVVQGLTVIEFGISGLDSFLVAVEPQDSAVALIGIPPAPSGMDTLTVTGGMDIAWPVCLTGDRVLAKLTLRPRTTWPDGGALRVTRRYPPTNPAIPTPLLARCDAPYYTQAPLIGGMYLYGREGPPVCSVICPETDFGGVLEGRSSTLTFTVENSGGGLLEGAASIAGPPDFALVAQFPIPPPSPYSLAHGERRTFGLRFSPTRLGEQSCTAFPGAGCDSLVFIASTAAPVPIRSLQEQRKAYVGKVVTVEGQPYIPPGNTGSGWEGWIQDESGRGLRLVGAVFSTSILLDPTNRVRLRGRLGRSGSNLQLETLENATLVGTGNEPIAPLLLPTGAANDTLLSGTFIQVTGRCMGREYLDELGWHYWVDDGSGYIHLRANPADAVAFPWGEYITARGAAQELYWSAYRWPGMVVRGTRNMFVAGKLELPVTRTSLGQTLHLPVHLRGNAWPIGTFGLRLTYDPSTLRFLGAGCCGLTAGSAGCDVQQIGADTILVWISTATPIPPGADGDVLCFDFEANTCGPSLLRLGGLTGDLVGIQPLNGRFLCTDCISDGDVNADSILTPADALCAFETYLNGGTMSADCSAVGPCAAARADVSCDAQVLPSDALAIFRRWLRGEGPPFECFAATPYATTSSCRIDATRAVPLGDDRVAIPLARQARGGEAAFAVRIDFDPAAEFIEFRAAPGAEAWAGLGARVVAPGSLLAGGFAAELPGGEAQDGEDVPWELLGEFVFRTRTAASVVRTIEWLEDVAGDSAEPRPEASPARIAVGAPWPNPASGSDVALDIAVPPGDATRFEIQVLDVRGRLVRVLHSGPLGGGLRAIRWDRRSASGEPVASGLYLIRVRAGDRVERRKVVVLE